MTRPPKTIAVEINLEDVLNYRHDETVMRFMDNYEMSFEEAADIFREMKLFLALMAKFPEEYIFTHEPLWVIDEMWHTFLMYTWDYEDFCKKYLGRMIHHAPTPRAQKMKIIEDLEINKAETEEMLRPIVSNLYNHIYDYLGRETLIKWIHTFTNKYTIEYMNSIRKPLQ